jgi:SlyX protein
MDDTALERIELRIAYLESANQELGDVVYRQQREIDQLRAQLAVYQQRLDSWSREQDVPVVVDERPPHY